MKMLTDEEIKKIGLETSNIPHGTEDQEIADVDGFVRCYTKGRDDVAEIIRTTPNDGDLGKKLRTLFLEKEVLHND